MNSKNKLKTLAGLLLAAFCVCGCSSVSDTVDYEADRRTKEEKPDGTKTTIEEGVKEKKNTTKTEVEKPSWLVELVNSVLKVFI